ncbi:MAG: sigma-70 family RNA polymerase sigma factor [Chloroflexota bacterium]
MKEVNAGMQRLGECLMPVARGQLNSERFDDDFVQDCVQLALISIWETLKKGIHPDSPATFLAWCRRITVNKCIDEVRKVKRRPADSLNELHDESTVTPLQSSAALDSTWPEPQVALTEERQELLLSLQTHPKLSGKSKTVLIEGFLLEQSDAEVAPLVPTPISNVRLIRFRNLKKLRDDSNFIERLRSD